MLDLLNINTIFFTIWDYPMSYLEFFGTILNIACVWLVARKNILTWPIGIIAVILFGILFYQIQLYSDVIEQGYYLVTGFWGWFLWYKLRQSKNTTPESTNDDISIRSATKQLIVLTLVAITIGTVALGYFMSNIHLIWPDLFPIAASYPYLDAFTTVMSFAAQLLMMYRYFENWILWIIVDVIGIWLYAAKGVVFVSMLYAIFLVIATMGLIKWYKDKSVTAEATL